MCYHSLELQDSQLSNKTCLHAVRLIIFELYISYKCKNKKKIKKWTTKNIKNRKYKQYTPILCWFRSKKIFWSKRSDYWLWGGGSKLKVQGTDSYPVNECTSVLSYMHEYCKRLEFKWKRFSIDWWIIWQTTKIEFTTSLYSMLN